jgi:membrane peptidoglycan carboxypeptidase
MPGHHSPNQLGPADQTMPLPAVARVSAERYGADASHVGRQGRSAGGYRQVGRRSFARRWLRRAAWFVGSLIVVGLAALLVLMLVTPSVGNARAVARAQAQSHHSPYPGPPVPARFAHALIATEDHRFGSLLEPGFDPFAVARVVFVRLTGGGDQGAATLYQQLAKVLYAPGVSGYKLYVYEMALGVKLWYSYSDAQILRMYAGVVYFGNNYYGLERASCGYFGVQPDRLSWPQAAVLAGLVQAPSAYDPLRYPALARSREGHVLGRLVATGVLTKRQASRALAVPVRRLLAPTRGCRA